MPSEWPEKEKRWTIQRVRRSALQAWAHKEPFAQFVRGPETEPIYVVAASRLEEVGAERDEWRERSEIVDQGRGNDAVLIAREQERAEQAESQLHALRGVLEEEVAYLQETADEAERDQDFATSCIFDNAAARLRSALHGSAVSGDAATENLPIPNGEDPTAVAPERPDPTSEPQGGTEGERNG